jgi:hypothetical protein
MKEIKLELIKQFDKQIYFELENELTKSIYKENPEFVKKDILEYKKNKKNYFKILEFKKNKKNLILCESYLAKQIFLKTIDFTINDWSKIRTGNYYEEIYLEKGINKKLYLLSKIESYLNK